jgi:hypothetical protein
MKASLVCERSKREEKAKAHNILTTPATGTTTRAPHQCVRAFFGSTGDTVGTYSAESLKRGNLSKVRRRRRFVGVGLPRLESIEDLGVCGNRSVRTRSRMGKEGRSNAPRTHEAQIASSNLHLALPTNSFKLALASPADSNAPNSLTHSVNSLSVFSNQ